MPKEALELIKGTLDMLILKVLSLGPMHGWGICQRIEQISRDTLRVQQGSLYPALHRLVRQGWIESEWQVTENQRGAKFYRLTELGASQLASEEEQWRRLSEGTNRILAAVGV